MPFINEDERDLEETIAIVDFAYAHKDPRTGEYYITIGGYSNKLKYKQVCGIGPAENLIEAMFLVMTQFRDQNKPQYGNQ